MKLFIVTTFLSLGTAVLSQGLGGGSAGGLLGYGGGHKLSGYIEGLSRGIEIKHGHGGGGDEGGDEGGHSGGGLSLGGGGGGGDGGHEGGSSGGDGGGDDKGHGHEESIGFGGSDFKTPVDVHHEEVVHLKAYPEFHYDYHVADHKHKDYHSKHEIRDGYKVKGSYSLLEPDHKTIRIVDYTSDKKQGFIAKVSYKKHA